MIVGVSDFLVTLQEKIAPYPPWVIACAGGIAVAIILILVAKAFRLAAIVFFVVALGMACWFGFRALTGTGDEGKEAPKTSGSAFSPAAVMIAMVGQPLSCQRFPVQCNTRQ